MEDNYIHLGDFEKYVRNRFKNIVNGKGAVIPRIAVKKALDDIFTPPEQINPADAKRLPCSCGSKLPDTHRFDCDSLK